MAIILIDGFDYFTNAQSDDLLGRWGLAGSAAGFLRETTTRNGHGAALELGGTRNITKTFTGAATIHVAFAFRWINTLSSTAEVLTLFETAVTTHLRLRMTTSGNWELRRGNFTTIATGTANLSPNTWYHIAIKAFVNNSTGTFELRIDGSATPDINFSGDTAEGGTPVIDSVSFVGNTQRFQFDDVVIADDTGSQPFLGDYDVYTIFPDGAGASTQFTPSAGSNWQNVDETTNDGDTTYNESSTLNHKDRFTMGNVPADTDVIYAVQVGAFAKKTTVGSRELRVVAYDGTTEGTGPSTALSATGYQWTIGMFEDHPSGAAAWTESEVNSMEAGYQVNV